MNIPDHVLSAFQVDEETPQALPSSQASSRVSSRGPAYRFGRIVIAPATATSAWSAKVRERLADSVSGVAIARPVRATDGRFVVAGFTANEAVEGKLEQRVDEVVAASLRLERALREVGAAGELPERASDDRHAEADRAVWRGYGLEADEPVGVAHLDMLRSTLFRGLAEPLVVDLEPSARPRPAGYSAALVIVDGLLADAVDIHVVERWAHIPDLIFLLGRALEYREILAASEGANIRANIRRVEELLMSR